MSYDVVLADPPWRYSFSRSDSRRIEGKYPTMAVAEIAALGAAMAPITSPSTVLFLWATMPKLREALAVIEGWGFAYTTGAAWDKELRGMGYYFRGQHELLLVGTRPKTRPPAPSARVGSVFRERRGRHSAKPECVYVALEAMYPDARRLEMFARSRRRGWDAWGNEVTGIQLPEAA